jgi:uncharacterized protein YecE (DUF72 family)
MSFRIGVAGWSIPSEHKNYFPKEGSHLERYAQTFNAVEINSSFYREHKPVTYKRWAETVPKDFRFSVKLNQIFTHEQHLEVNEKELVDSLNGIRELGDRWGALLVQIPPSLDYHLAIALTFFKTLRKHYDGPVVFEPRHISWQVSQTLLRDFDISKVKADPEICRMPEAEAQASLPYERLHGSPIMYRSSYFIYSLEKIAAQMKKDVKRVPEVWCIFDNTALFHATKNALELKELLNEKVKKRPVDLDSLL